MFIRTEPQLFLEMLRLRVGLIIQASVIIIELLVLMSAAILTMELRTTREATNYVAT
jgi:hypothetical protein